MEEFRANPDELLKKIEAERRPDGKGHLKIFFGYAAGVGKTYAMLKAAHAAKRRGIDVAAGYVEPHARPDTLALLNGLEKLPEQIIQYKNITLREFALDAALNRRPQLILVDELAHTNAEGCRHTKRYQDVEELLKAGIDVYTTVNVQHIESLNDQIAAITGITVQERIPDSVFDNADQVELVDIEPADLMERLNAGKIYRETQAKKALGNFFDAKNLTALREIALRRCADRVNKISGRNRSSHQDNYYTDEHILVCISASPTNPKIIRTAARMADAFRGSFTGLFVETSRASSMSAEDKKRLRENIRLAVQLGASIETVYGDDIPLQISQFARLSGVSKLVMGRSTIQRKYFWSKPSLTERLISYAPTLDIYVIPDQSTPVFRSKKKRKEKMYFSLPDTLRSSSLLCLATLLGLLFQRLGFSESNIIMIYILGVLLTAVLTSERVYSLVVSILSVLAFNFFFTDPYYTLKADGPDYPVTFLIMFLSAFITSSLAVQMKRQTIRISETAYRTKILLETNQLIQKEPGKKNIISVAASQLVKLLDRSIIFYPVENGLLGEPLTFSPEGQEAEAGILAPNERAVASWVYKNNKHAGAFTNTLGDAKCLYLSVRINDTVYGVVGLALGKTPLDSFENNILLSILGECALALENEATLREREESAILAKNEQLRANLLRSISHDLRTPLTAISGNAGILLNSKAQLDDKNRAQIYLDIYDDSQWLINLVENLLSVTRIEDGTMKLRMSADLMDDVIEEALRHISRKQSEHVIKVCQEEELILARMDARLIVQVIINIVDNAVKYTPPGSEITISARRQDKLVVVEISDNGEGIPDEDKERIFDMFYTTKTGAADSRRSLGLGLALCKSIITAHGGEITVLDHQPSGATFRFTLPAEEVTLHE